MIKRIAKHFADLGIRGIPVFVMTFTVLLSLSFTFWVRYQMRTRTVSMIAETQPLLRELQYATRYSTLAKRKANFETFAKNLFKFGKVIEITMWDSEGNQVFYGLKTDSGPALPVRPEDQEELFEQIKLSRVPFFIERDQTIETWAPIISGKDLLDEGELFNAKKDAPFETLSGIVRMVSRVTPVSRKEYLLNNGLIALASLLICSAVAFLFAKLFVKSVAQTTETMRAFAAGYEYTPPPEEKKGYAGELANAFNSITGRVRQTVDECNGRVEMLSAFLEKAPNATVVSSMEGTIVFINKRAADLLGFTSTTKLLEASGNFYKHLDRHSRVPFREYLKEARKSGHTNPETFSMIGADKSSVRAELTVSFSTEGFAPPIYFIVSGRAAKVRPSYEHEDLSMAELLERHVCASVSTTFEIGASLMNRLGTPITLGSPRLRDMWNDIMALPQVKTIPEDMMIGGFPFSEAKIRFPEDVADIWNSGKLMGRVIDGFIQRPTEPEDDVDMNAVIRVAIEIAKAYTLGKPVKFEFLPCKDLPTVWGKYRHFEVMIVFLLKIVANSLPNPKKIVYVTTFQDRIEKTAVTLIRGGNAGRFSKDSEDAEENDDKNELDQFMSDDGYIQYEKYEQAMAARENESEQDSEEDELNYESYVPRETKSEEIKRLLQTGIIGHQISVAKMIAQYHKGTITIDAQPDKDILLRISFIHKQPDY